MKWTQFLEHPEEVTGLFQEEPALEGFYLEQIVLENGRVLVEGELADRPDPLPERWAARGYTRVRVRMEMRQIQSARIEGVPHLDIVSNAQLKGQSVDLSITESDARNNEGEPFKKISATNGPCEFDIECGLLSVELSGI